ncbi:MAG: LPS export ABC transporter periplasmic protein LptC [Desulfuromonas sp.]|uniref:LPS export ABC transporter periplasmic protein LptC n=1 Tax=Desulfuromonas sp. TaxID=892 RepID=UPI000CBDFB44|nr:LPS export ABC transporter periplasmic protein LptC [Desulfuromonas sp.]PLX86030.1 MAG: LPS export ABC transporter periplasmic protein LptC [Desulfuromonas sp.]
MAGRWNARNALALIILCLVAALTFMVARNFQGDLAEEIVDVLPRDVDLSLKGLSYTETRDGQRRWFLEADSAAYKAEEATARIENIRMTFYGHEELGDLALTALSGALNRETREVEVQGDVKVRSERGDAFFTESLRYRESDRILRTDDPVRVVSQNLEVTGKGLRMSVQDRSFVLLSRVKARWEGLTDGSGEQ